MNGGYGNGAAMNGGTATAPDERAYGNGAA